uniref:Uncharacterized protein n=1 Tax=Schistosoma curassoni TaxID=6186 RepID=A0A183L2M3_9TREM
MNTWCRFTNIIDLNIILRLDIYFIRSSFFSKTIFQFNILFPDNVITYQRRSIRYVYKRCLFNNPFRIFSFCLCCVSNFLLVASFDLKDFLYTLKCVHNSSISCFKQTDCFINVLSTNFLIKSYSCSYSVTFD